jgi:hypothetical protein
MGWTYGWNSKEEIVRHLLDEQGTWTPIARSIVGNHLWAVLELKTPREGLANRFIFLALLACDRSDGVWGYKDMEESMGPCEVDCPLKYLDMVPDPGGYATEWREKVRAFHSGKRTKQALIKSIRPGMRLKLIDGCRPPEITVISTSPLVGYADGGGRYKIQPRHIDRVLEVA